MVSWWKESLLSIPGVSNEVCRVGPWKCRVGRRGAMVGCAISAVRGEIKMKPGENIQHIVGIKMATSDIRIRWREVMF